jgi:hypothetical protein
MNTLQHDGTCSDEYISADHNGLALDIQMVVASVFCPQCVKIRVGDGDVRAKHRVRADGHGLRGTDTSTAYTNMIANFDLCSRFQGSENYGMIHSKSREPAPGAKRSVSAYADSRTVRAMDNRTTKQMQLLVKLDTQQAQIDLCQKPERVSGHFVRFFPPTHRF